MLYIPASFIVEMKQEYLITGDIFEHHKIDFQNESPCPLRTRSDFVNR